ncbi:putative flippase GtrA [Rhizobium sp. BK312]|uniref:GtrA family protein n=1 Tax=Rhizobium sp. BK312 TaxID=2587080 RepID=UPI000DDC0B03|nr:GtrA family protein [Rhizobium sp. BK312]MBB3426608.1 putative flippase GtrA [Rhizobium sp. BK312]
MDSRRFVRYRPEMTRDRQNELPESGLASERLQIALIRLNLKSAWRFAVVGLLQNATSYCLLLLLISLGWPAWRAVLLLSPIAMTVSFIANRNWTFQDSKKTGGQFRKYVITCALSYAGAVSFTWLQESIGVSSWLAALVTTGTAAGVSYLILNFLVFPSSQPSVHQ